MKKLLVTAACSFFLLSLLTLLPEAMAQKSEDPPKEGPEKQLFQTKCQKCPEKYICGGSCHAINYALSGRLDRPPEKYCQVIKQQIACSREANKRIDELLKT